MKRSQHSLTRLIEQVLSFAKMEAGRLDYDFENVNVHDTASRVGELIEPQATSPGVWYVCDSRDRDALARADRERLEIAVGRRRASRSPQCGLTNGWRAPWIIPRCSATARRRRVSRS